MCMKQNGKAIAMPQYLFSRICNEQMDLTPDVVGDPPVGPEKKSSRR